MYLLACVDDDGGTLFNRRRQTQDRALRTWLLGYAAEQGFRLVVSPYTAGQFAPGDLDGTDADAAVAENPFEVAGERDLVFAEDLDPVAAAGRLAGVLLVRWNRRYPHDRTFPAELLAGRTRRQIAELAGSSHPRITVESWS